MSYKPNTTWEFWEGRAGSTSRMCMDAVSRGGRDYEEWNRFAAGRTNAEIAAALSVTEAQVAELYAVFASAKEMYDHVHNQPVTQADRAFAFRQFGG